MYRIKTTTFISVLFPLADSPINTVNGFNSRICTSFSGPRFFISIDSLILSFFLVYYEMISLNIFKENIFLNNAIS